MGHSASDIAEQINKNPRYVNLLLVKMGYLEGRPGHYTLTDKGREHGRAKGRSYFQWDEYVVKDITRGQFLKKLAITIGHIISYIEEIEFIGLVALIICILPLRIDLGLLIKLSSGPMSHVKCCSIFMLSAIAGYPLSCIISWAYQRALKFYNDEYQRIPFISIMGINIYKDLLFPFGLIAAPAQAMSRIRVIAIIKKIIYFSVLWLLPIVFIVIGIKGIK